MIRLRIIAGCLLLLGGGLQGWTQYRAYHYRYDPALGRPLWQVQAFYQRHALYAPWAVLGWAWQWDGTSRRLQIVGGGVASGTLLVLIAMFGGGTRHSRTQPPPMQGHGTTVWATRKDVQKSRLFAKRGLVLGSFRGRVLRFDGQENVLLVGPQRAGKELIASKH